MQVDVQRPTVRLRREYGALRHRWRRPKEPPQQLASVNYVTPSFLKTLRIPLLEGKYLIKPAAAAMGTLPSLIGILPAATFAVRIPWNRSCKWVIGFSRLSA